MLTDLKDYEICPKCGSRVVYVTRGSRWATWGDVDDDIRYVAMCPRCDWDEEVEERSEESEDN